MGNEKINTIGTEIPFVDIETPVQEQKQKPEILEVEAVEMPRNESEEKERVVYIQPQEEVLGTFEDIKNIEKKIPSPEKTAYTFEGAHELQTDLNTILERKKELENHPYNEIEKKRQEVILNQKENLKKFLSELDTIQLAEISEYLEMEGVPHTTEGFFEFIESKKKIPKEVIKMSEIVSSLMGERSNQEKVFPTIHEYEPLKKKSDFEDQKAFINYLQEVSTTINSDANLIKSHLENMSEYIQAYTVELETELGFTFIKKPDIENDKSFDLKIDEHREKRDGLQKELQEAQAKHELIESLLKDEQASKVQLEAQVVSTARTEILRITNDTIQELENSLKDQAAHLKELEAKIATLTAEMDGFKSKKVGRIKSEYTSISDDIYDRANDFILAIGDAIGNAALDTQKQILSFIEDAKNKLGDSIPTEQEEKLKDMLKNKVEILDRKQKAEHIEAELNKKVGFFTDILHVAEQYLSFENK